MIGQKLYGFVLERPDNKALYIGLSDDGNETYSKDEVVQAFYAAMELIPQDKVARAKGNARLVSLEVVDEGPLVLE